MNTLTLLKGENGLELFHQDGNWIMLKEFGYSPVQMLVASIGGCGAYVVKSVLERSSIAAKVGNVRISYTIDDTSKAKKLKSVHIVFAIQADESLHQKVHGALRLVNEFCPVIQSLDPSIEIVKTVEFVATI